MSSAQRGLLVAAEARAWLGTPLHEQQATKGTGCDCKGLLWGVARDLGFPEADSFYATFIGYDLKRGGGIPVPLLREGLDQLFDRRVRGDDLLPGDVLLHRSALTGQPYHLSIVATARTAIHTQVEPASRVKEATLRSLLALCPLDAAYRWRALNSKGVPIPCR